MSEEVRVSRRDQLAARMRRLRWQAVSFIAAAAVVGAVAGLVWAKAAPLPSYTVLENHTAYLPERQEAMLVGADVWFSLIVGCIGVAIGILGWLLFRRSSWMVLAVPLVATAVAALVCWQVGEAVGPSDFAERLAAAEVGASVQVDLQLRALAALLVAPFATITPLMLLAAFWPERLDEEPAAEAA